MWWVRIILHDVCPSNPHNHSFDSHIYVVAMTSATVVMKCIVKSVFLYAKYSFFRFVKSCV